MSLYRWVSSTSAEQKLADVGAIGANAIAGWTWINEVNDLLQLVLTIIGIIAGVVAIRYHLKKTEVINAKQSNDSRK